MALLPLFDRHIGTRLHLPIETPRRPSPRRAIGLLGGSFNPAHEGHRYVSIEALRRLALDEIWWLVSPQNPLKPIQGMAPLDERMATARRVAKHPRIRVSDLEMRLGTRYTVDTLAHLRSCRDEVFVWLIGADNLVQMTAWRQWQRIFRLAPIAVFDRQPYSHAALASKAARALESTRLAETRADRLKHMPPPAWTFVRLRPHPASSTLLRAGVTTAATSAERKP